MEGSTIWLNYVWVLDSIENEEFTSNQWEVKVKYKLLVKRDKDSKFLVESNKNPFDDWLQKWVIYSFPVWVNTFAFMKDWVQKIWLKFYIRDTPIEVEA
jgi:hypothetical protein